MNTCKLTLAKTKKQKIAESLSSFLLAPQLCNLCVNLTQVADTQA